MDSFMNWLSDPQAPYVLAAYGVAGVTLLTLIASSLMDSRRAKRDWQKFQGRREQP